MFLSLSGRTEQLYQNVLTLWHHSHINMKSVVSWHYLMADVRAIRNWNVASVGFVDQTSGWPMVYFPDDHEAHPPTPPFYCSNHQIKTMLPGEHQQVLSNLQSHFDEFLEDSGESEVFAAAERAELERDVSACKEYYQELLRSAERGKFPLAGLEL